MNADGTADYAADTSGNGVVDPGEVAWFNRHGQWSQPFAIGSFSAIHAHLLPTGKVLFYQNHHAWLYDPASSATTHAADANYHLFCSGHCFLSDGTLFVAGGHIGTPAGERSVAVYSPFDDFWTRLPPLDKGRWYPTCLTLDTGEALILTGSYATGELQLPIDYHRLPWIWQPSTGTYRSLTAAPKHIELYPFAFLTAPGTVFQAGPSLGQVFYTGPPPVPDPGETVKTTRRLTTAGLGNWTAVAELNQTREQFASAVMFRPGQVLVSGGINPTGGRHVIGTAEIMDLNQPNAAWAQAAPMNHARQQHNLTLLPDGTVLATGGINIPALNPQPEANGFFPPGNVSVRAAELWAPDPLNPAQWSWTTLADCPRYRGYHSTALLLPDGRVWSAGGDYKYPYAPNGQGGTFDAELFSPPYLFKGPRPTIASLPAAALTYGQAFTVQTAATDSVWRVTLLRLASVTHAFNANQRFLELSFTGGNGSWSVTTPSDAGQCPPGHYLLFVIHSRPIG